MTEGLRCGVLGMAPEPDECSLIWMIPSRTEPIGAESGARARSWRWTSNQWIFLVVGDKSSRTTNVCSRHGVKVFTCSGQSGIFGRLLTTLSHTFIPFVYTSTGCLYKKRQMLIVFEIDFVPSLELALFLSPVDA